MFAKTPPIILVTGLLVVTSAGAADGNRLRDYVPWIEATNVTATGQSLSCDSRSESIDSFIISLMSSYNVPGVAAAAISSGEIIWSKGYGYANIEESIPASDTTLFMLASISKTFTGTALMQLWERDLLELDDNISDYMPFDIVNPNHAELPIPFRSLMSHTSSLDDNWDVMYSTYVQGDTPIPLEHYVQDYFLPGGVYYDPIKNFELWPPEANWEYCNHNFVLIGYLVQAIAGMPFDQYCNDSLFSPLGLTQTCWFLAGLDTNNVAMPYSYSSGTHTPLGHFGYADYPAGTLRTNAIQLARFLNMFLHDGELDGVRILESETVDTMLTIHYPNLSLSQGLPWFYQKIGTRWVWQHGGGDQGVSTLASFCPYDSTAVVVLANLSSYWAVNSISNEIFVRLSDPDFDSVPDLIDNCPDLFNSSQEDQDADEIGDSCDNCIYVYNPDQTDSDFDSVGDSCDLCAGFDDRLDYDGDLVPDSCDNCLLVQNPDQADGDHDGIGDTCDPVFCGDVDLSGGVDIDDVVYLIAYIFSGGPAPDPYESGDVDYSGGIDLDDVVYLIAYIFSGGPEPMCP